MYVYQLWMSREHMVRGSGVGVINDEQKYTIVALLDCVK